MPNQDAASFYNPLLNSQLASNKSVIHDVRFELID